MEDVLSIYERPVDRLAPLICLDEFCKQLLSETRSRIAPAKGQLEKYDYEYIRNGSVSGFMMTAPFLGKRHTYFGPDGRRTSKDFAHCLDYLAHEIFPDARRIILVMDNLNTHKAAALYESFAPAKALALWQRFEVHYTPKHGSWLNMAEIEIGLMTRRCLNRRIASFEEIKTEVGAYEATKNKESKVIAWQFTNDKARTKLKSLYPSI